MNASGRGRPTSAEEIELRRLLRAQTAGAVAMAGVYTQWASIAAQLMARGARELGRLADDPQAAGPDAHERVAANLTRDFADALRAGTAVAQGGALRLAREIQKQGDEQG